MRISKKGQQGFTIVEAIAYLAIYGAIGAAVLGGAGAIIREVGVRRDIAAVVKAENEVRSEYATKNGSSPNSAKTVDLSSGKSVTLNPTGIETINAERDCYIAYSFSITIPKLSIFECTKYWSWNWKDTIVLLKTIDSSSNAVYNIDNNCNMVISDPDFCEDGKDFTVYFK